MTQLSHLQCKINFYNYYFANMASKSIRVLLCRIANRFVSRQGPQYKALLFILLYIILNFQ